MKAEIRFEKEHLTLTGVEVLSISERFVSFYLKGIMDNATNWQICVNHGALVSSMRGYAFVNTMSRAKVEVTLMED